MTTSPGQQQFYPTVKMIPLSVNNKQHMWYRAKSIIDHKSRCPLFDITGALSSYRSGGGGTSDSSKRRRPRHGVVRDERPGGAAVAVVLRNTAALGGADPAHLLQYGIISRPCITDRRVAAAGCPPREGRGGETEPPWSFLFHCAHFLRARSMICVCAASLFLQHSAYPGCTGMQKGSTADVM